MAPGADPTRERADRGVVLVYVLWGLALLTLVAGGLSTTTRSDARVAANIVAQGEARLAAEAGIALAVLDLLEPPDARRWRPDGTPRPITFAAATITVAVADEAGKLDLNRGSDALLRRLLEDLGLSADDAGILVARIADFRDRDGDARAGGAEITAYHAHGLGHGPADRPFRAVDELLQVPGMTERLYSAVQPVLTIHGRGATVDPGVAPPLLLRALPGIDDGALDRFLATRADPAAGSGLLPSSPLLARPSARGQGTTFTVSATATGQRGGRAHLAAIVRLTGDADRPYHVLDWREDLASPAAGGPET